MSGKRRERYRIVFTLEVNGHETPDSVEEAVTTMVDEELSLHNGGGARCGVSFADAYAFNVERLD